MPVTDGEFEDFETTIEAGGRGIPVRVTANALHGLWGAGSGPQTAQGIFDEYRALFDDVIADKIERGDLEHGVAVIRDADLDM